MSTICGEAQSSLFGGGGTGPGVGVRARLVLYLAFKRVFPYSLHPSLWETGGTAQSQLRVLPKVRRARPVRAGVSRGGYAAVVASWVVVGWPEAMVGFHAVRVVMTTNSCLSRLPATATRACASVSRLAFRVVRWV